MRILKYSTSEESVANQGNQGKKKKDKWKHKTQNGKEKSTSSLQDNSNNKGKLLKREFHTCAY